MQIKEENTKKGTGSSEQEGHLAGPEEEVHIVEDVDGLLLGLGLGQAVELGGDRGLGLLRRRRLDRAGQVRHRHLDRVVVGRGDLLLLGDVVAQQHRLVVHLNSQLRVLFVLYEM